MNINDLSPEEREEYAEIERIIKKSPEEINLLCDTGTFNSIIEGYCRIVFDDLGLSEHLKGYSFSELFDEVSAADARTKCK